MKIMLLAFASALALPVYASQDRDTSDPCLSIDIMMGVHKALPVKPHGFPEAPLLPKNHKESRGPAVLIPSCRDDGTTRRKKGDYPLA